MSISPTIKKILYSVLFLAAVGAVVYLMYIVFFRPSAPTPPVNVNNGNVGLPNVNDILNNANINNGNVNNANTAEEPGIPGVDKIAAGGLTETEIITPGINAVDPAASKDDSIRYYSNVDGQFYKVDKNGNVRQLGKAKFANAEKVTWSDASNEVILEFPDGANVYYNLDNDRQVTLPKEYEDFDFSPTGSQISFKYMHIDPERRVLAVSSPDGTGARTLESLGLNGDRVTVDWSPKGTVAARYAEFIDANRQELGFIGLSDENFKTTIVEGRGLRSTYSPDGEQLLYSTYSIDTDYKPTLWTVDADGNNIGKNRQQINVQTFADKCAFASDATTVYCGVPTESRYGFGLEPDILQGVSDDIYKINTKTGAKTRIAIPTDSSGNTGSYSVDNMFVTSDNSALMFRDNTTGQLVRINLQ